MTKKVISSLISASIMASGCALMQPKPPVKALPPQPVKVTAVQVTALPEDVIVVPTPVLKNSVANSYVKSTKKMRHRSTSTRNFLGNNSFDFVYSGDVVGIPLALKQYDPSIKILQSLGSKKVMNVSINQNSIDINTIQAIIDSNTSGRVKLAYSRANNSLRIIYNSKVVTVGKSAVNESLKWQDGTSTPSPILSKDGLVLFPYGQYEPEITCQPLQLCDIQLQAGETVKGLMIGDSVRWNEGDGSVPVVYSGSDAAPIPHVVLKPVYPGLETTLLITTNKRTYYMKLLSSNSANLSRVGFYYPNEELQQIETKRIEEKAKADEILSDGDMPGVDPRKMRFNYKISGDTSAKFKPVQVFDDGTNVYIQMPDNIRQTDLPAFYVLGQDGKTLELVNFQWKKPFYVVHKIFDSGVLILGLDDNQQKITINRQEKPGFWARLFGA